MLNGGKCFTFDLDGTITKRELLPLVASTLGLEREISLLTQLTISGAIAFEDSFRLRFAILKSAPISVVRSCIAEIELDSNIVAFINDHKKQCFVVTGNLDFWIEPLIERLGCEVLCSTGERAGDYVTALRSVMHKGVRTRELRDRFDQIIAIGDSANDVPMFDAADIGVAYGGVHCPVEALIGVADYVTFDSTSLCRLLRTL